MAKGYIVLSNLPYRFSTFMVPKRTQKRKDTSSTIAPSMPSPERTSLHFPILHSALKTCKDWKSLVNLTSIGGTTISESAKAMNGKAHSRHEEDYLNPKSCSSECPTCQPVFNTLSTTKEIQCQGMAMSQKLYGRLWAWNNA